MAPRLKPPSSVVPSSRTCRSKARISRGARFEPELDARAGVMIAGWCASPLEELLVAVLRFGSVLAISPLGRPRRRDLLRRILWRKKARRDRDIPLSPVL